MQRLVLTLLGLSAVANLALVFALPKTPLPRSPDLVPATPPATSGSREQTPAGSGSGNNEATTAVAGVDASTWQRLGSEDPRLLVENLRTAGFPREAIRAALNALLDQKYRARLDAVNAQLADVEYWNPVRFVNNDPKLQAELRTIAAERQQLTKELLGTNVPNLEGRRNRHARYGELPDEKLDAVERIVSDYADLESNLTSWPSSLMNYPWDREQLAALATEKRKDLAAVLTPAELEIFDLRNCPTARNLRNRLTAFDATHDEFRALFALQRALDEKYGVYVLGVPTEQRRADQEQLNRQIEAALGESRYQDYLRANDAGYRAAFLLAERLNLPADTASKVHAVQLDTQKRAAALRSESGKSAAETSAALAALASEARTHISDLLTERGSQTYFTTAGGWLRMLGPPRTNATPTSPPPAR